MNPYWLLCGAIVFEVIATIAMKYSEGLTKFLPSAVSAIGYCISFYFLALTLKAVPLGIAYAIWSGAGIVLISAIAWLFQSQKLDLAAISGMTMIVGGVLIINLFSKSPTY